ncbi:MAG: hypothetical protein HQM10_20925 [Candidatus Riflebacteria bacterium]|nr:hypothetical protein [Candidatus Riflebacteria bacterium]
MMNQTGVSLKLYGYWGKLIVFALILCIFISASASHCAEVKKESLSTYVLRLYQRVISLGNIVLDFEDRMIFSYENHRPTDPKRDVARLKSGRRQIRNLFLLGRRLERKIPPSDSKFPQIQATREKIRYFINEHRKRITKLIALGGDEIINAAKAYENVADDLDTNVDVDLMIKDIEDKF